MKTKTQSEEGNQLQQKEEEDTNNEYEGEVHVGINTEDDGKIIIQTKPREEYLQKKIEEMNFNDEVINGVTKGLGLSLDNIKNELDEEKVLITEVTNDNKIKKYVEENEEREKIHKTDEQSLMSKKNLQKLRNFREEKEKLNNYILKLDEKKKFIEEEGMMNLSEVDKNLKMDQLKKIKNQTLSCNQRINVIDYQIKNILADEYNLTREEKIKNFLNNFDKEKEKTELISKEYYKKYREKKDLIKKIDEQNKIISEKELDKIEENKKKEQELILQNAKKIIEKERENREKIKQLKEQKDKETLEKLQKHNEEKTEEQKEIEKKFINQKKNDCVYVRNKKMFLENEEKYLQTEINENKKLFPIIRLEEIKEFKKKMDKNHSKKMTEIDDKYHKIKEDWKKNQNELPKFKNHLLKIADEESKKLLEEDENHKNKLKEYVKAKKAYSELLKDKKPEVSEKLKKEREEKIKQLTQKIIVKDTLYDYKKDRILLVKRDPNKPSRFNWELKLDEIDENDPLQKSVEIKKALIKKPKRIILSSSIERKRKKELPKKKIDYLKELINKRNKTELNSENVSVIKKEQSKWEKMINDNKKPIKVNIETVKMKAEQLEQLAQQNEQLLKLKGGIEKNPELGQKISDLIVDSIHAKLSILNSIGNK